MEKQNDELQYAAALIKIFFERDHVISPKLASYFIEDVSHQTLYDILASRKTPSYKQAAGILNFLEKVTQFDIVWKTILETGDLNIPENTPAIIEIFKHCSGVSIDRPEFVRIITRTDLDTQTQADLLTCELLKAARVAKKSNIKRLELRKKLRGIQHDKIA